MRYHHVSGQTKTVKKQTITYRATIFAIAGVFALTAVFGATNLPKTISADSYDDQIAAQQAKANSAQTQLQQALAEAGSYQAAVSNLQSQQNDLQNQINSTQAKINDLNSQIAQTEQQIKDQSATLARTLATIYNKQQSSSTLDILMNSNSVSDYVDAMSQQNSMKNQMTTSIGKINDLKSQLQDKKNQSSKLLREQQVKRDQIAENKNQQQQLLNQANSDAGTQQNNINTAKAKISSLREQQAAAQKAANDRYSGTSVGGSTYYPFANASPFNPYGCLNRTFSFGGGTCARQCASYVEWEAYVKTGTRATNSGNAKEWWNTWSSIRSSTPRVNSAVVWGIGGYGHIAWVEQVNSPTDIVISQYNADFTGKFSRVEIDPNKYMLAEIAPHQYVSTLLGYLYF